MSELARVVVVGAGLAGLRVTEELRTLGYDGDLTLIGAENRPPYDRPPLSKKVLTGEIDDTGLRPDLAGLGVVLRLGESATGLGDGILRTDAAEYRWDALVLATGASPVRLPGDGPQQVLRTADDAFRLRAQLTPGTRLVIVGAGWIGAELATAAAARGCQVTVLEAAAAPLAGAVGPEIGRATVGWYADAGVDLRLHQGVTAIESDGVSLYGGDLVPADLVVTAVGVRPAVQWLDGSAVRLDNGVAVDGQLRSSVPGVFAAGDCASFWSGRYQRRLRFEHWDIALHAPEVVAANILGGTAAYDPVPYFWSEQFGRMLQYVGWHGAGDRLIWRGDPAAGRWAACWLARDRLVAALTVGLPRDLLQSRRLIEAGGLADPDKLADPDIPVREAALAA
jgi:3-phenylpropionate/trans-cinnamate dioxygenase ferredoxin reductase component